MGIISEPMLFVIALIDTGSVLFILVYFVSFLYFIIERGALQLFSHLLNQIKHLPNSTKFIRKSLARDFNDVIVLSDLECDYLNARECCSRLNTWIKPKLIAHSFLEFLLLTHGHLMLYLVNFPMTLWLLYEYYGVPIGNTGVYDPTEIHNRGQLKRHIRECLIYLGYYLIFFFIYLYCMIIALLKGDPINRNEADLVES